MLDGNSVAESNYQHESDKAIAEHEARQDSAYEKSVQIEKRAFDLLCSSEFYEEFNEWFNENGMSKESLIVCSFDPGQGSQIVKDFAILYAQKVAAQEYKRDGIPEESPKKLNIQDSIKKLSEMSRTIEAAVSTEVYSGE